MKREAILLAIDVLIRVGFGVWALFCLRYLWRSFRRDFVYINGQVATRKAEPLGFWLAVFSLVGVVGMSIYVVLNGL